MNRIDLARQEAANSDMRRARRNGHLMICNTLKGTVSLSFNGDRGNKVNRVYTLTGPDGAVLATGQARDVRPVLRAVYDVRVDDAVGAFC
jgi:hypothetical protein